MEISSLVLYLIAAPVAFIRLLLLLYKRKYSFFQLVCYFVLFFCITAKISTDFFPFRIGALDLPEAELVQCFWVPFSAYIYVIRETPEAVVDLLQAAALALVMAYCICMLLTRVRSWKSLLITMAFLCGSELLSVVSVLIFKNTVKYVDTGMFICYAAGALAGSFIYWIFRDYEENQKRRNLEDDNGFAGQ